MNKLYCAVQFQPKTGPKEGGTRITIVGENLGKIVDDVRAGVVVANKTCDTHDLDYLY